MVRPVGWRSEAVRHSLAARGIRTGRRFFAGLSPDEVRGMQQRRRALQSVEEKRGLVASALAGTKEELDAAVKRRDESAVIRLSEEMRRLQGVIRYYDRVLQHAGGA